MAQLNDRQLAEIIVEWARDEVSELRAGYPYAVGTKYGELPDVSAVVNTAETREEDRENFPFAALQQFWLEVFTVEISIMERPGESESEAAEFDAALRGYVATLVGSAQENPTLGDRLPTDPMAFVSPKISRDFTPPFQVYEDGTTGRLGVIDMRVAQVREDPS